MSVSGLHLEEIWQRELERLFSLASEGATWSNNMKPGKPSLAVRSALLGHLVFSLCCSKKGCFSAWYAFIQLLGILLSEVNVYNRARLHGVRVLFPLNPTPVLPLPGHYGEEGQLHLSSVWLSLTGLSLQNMMAIQACGFYRSRCILRVSSCSFTTFLCRLRMLPVHSMTAKGTDLQIEVFLKILICLADIWLIGLACVPHML